LLLVDRGSGEPLAMDYNHNLKAVVDKNKDLRGVELRLPPEIRLPVGLRAYVLVDVFPLAQQDFDI
jgi:hypothetical protein